MKLSRLQWVGGKGHELVTSGSKSVNPVIKDIAEIVKRKDECSNLHGIWREEHRLQEGRV